MAEFRIYQVPERIKLAMKMLALERGTTLNALCIKAMEEWLASQKKK